jgi:hypothetical protein
MSKIIATFRTLADARKYLREHRKGGKYKEYFITKDVITGEFRVSAE